MISYFEGSSDMKTEVMAAEKRLCQRNELHFKIY